MTGRIRGFKPSHGKPGRDFPVQRRAQGRRTGLVFGAGASSISACSGSLSACTASAGPIQIGSASMIPARVGRVRMDQNAQFAVVEHQPGHQFGKYLPGKGHLIHGLVVRTDLDVVPAPERDREALADPGAQLLGLGPRRRRIVIDMGVVACDLAQGRGPPASGSPVIACAPRHRCPVPVAIIAATGAWSISPGPACQFRVRCHWRWPSASRRCA